MRETVSLPCAGGTLSLEIFSAGDDASRPAVIFTIDGFGPREPLFEMAERIARMGYVVALPDLFHRAGSVLELTPPGVEREVKALFPVVMGDPDLRARWRERFYQSATHPQHIREDFQAVLDHLARRIDVRPGPVGIVGYCMGGGIAMRAAALFGDRIGAVGVFHGGMLATEAPDSPHLGAPKIRGELLVVGAIEDPSFPDDMKARLQESLERGQTHHTLETYPARHGFCVPDAPTYDSAAAERHFQAIEALMARAL